MGELFYKSKQKFLLKRGTVNFFFTWKKKLQERHSDASVRVGKPNAWSNAPSIVPSALFLIPKVRMPGSSDCSYTQNQEVRKYRFSAPMVSIWWRGCVSDLITRTLRFVGILHGIVGKRMIPEGCPLGETRRRAIYQAGTNHDTAATIRGDSPLNFRLSYQKINAVAP